MEFKWSAHLGLFLRTAAALSRNKTFASSVESLVLILLYGNNIWKSKKWPRYMFSPLINKCSWSLFLGFPFPWVAAGLRCFPVSSEEPCPCQPRSSARCARAASFPLLGIITFQGILLMCVHPVLLSEHTVISPSTMEVLFLRQNCLVMGL